MTEPYSRRPTAPTAHGSATAPSFGYPPANAGRRVFAERDTGPGLFARAQCLLLVAPPIGLLLFNRVLFVASLYTYGAPMGHVKLVEVAAGEGMPGASALVRRARSAIEPVWADH